MKSNRSLKMRAVTAATRLQFCLAVLCLLCGGAVTAEPTIAVQGLPAQAQGDVFAQVVSDEPIRSVKMTIPGVLDRTERHPPYGLASDTRGTLNAFDTTAHPDGDYVLKVTATFADGRTVTQNFPFAIDNDAPAAGAPATGETVRVVVAGLPQTVRGTVFPEVRVNQPVDSVRMDIDNILERVERHPPYGLMSDSGGRINPFDTRPFPNGDYVLNLTIQLKDGRRATADYAFTIDNAPDPQDAKVTLDVAPTPGPTIPEIPADDIPTPPATADGDTPGTPDPSADDAPVEVQVLGLASGATVRGDLKVHAEANQPVESVRFTIPGLLDRTERFPPYAVASDAGGSINPWDTSSLPNGPHTLNITVSLADGRTVNRSIAFSVDNPADPDPSDDSADAEDPDPVTPEDPVVAAGDGPSLRPGSGFSGSFSAPNRVGNPNARGGKRIAIARWDVVPEQTFAGEFPIGVVAHHVYGIDYVEFQVEGGTPVRVSKSSINPRTRVNEYWTVLDADDFPDGRIEVRAVAYPRDGVPRKLEPLFLFANDGGSVKHPVVELPAGRHTIDGRDIPAQGWLTFRPAPGVAKKDCVIVGRSRWSKGNVKFEGLTLESSGQALSLGSFNKDKERDMVWYDDVDIRGTRETKWVAQSWSHQYFTDVSVKTVSNAFKHGPVLVRNVTAEDIRADFGNARGMYVNVTVRDLDRREYSSAHPDLFQFPAGVPENTIIQDLTAVDNIVGQGLFADQITDMAIVRTHIRSASPYQALHLVARTENLLIKESTFNNGRFRSDVNFRADDVLLRDTRVVDLGPLYLPGGWDAPGVTVLPPPPLFD